MSKLRSEIENLAIDDKGSWLKKARYRRDNRAWLRKAHRIAVNVLRVLDEKGIQQKELAKSLNISPQKMSEIVKGKQNLTLEMISRLEEELGVRLIDITDHKIQVDK